MLLEILAAAAMLGAKAMPSPVLVRGDVVEERYIEDALGSPEEVTIGGPTRVRVRVRKVLIGTLPQRTRQIETVVSMASQPATQQARDIYLLVEREGDNWRGIHWAPAKHGICIPDGYVQERGIEVRVTALKKRGIVVCD